jgi:hypothetical protein
MSRQNVYNNFSRRESKVYPKFLVSKNNIYPQNPSRLLQNDFQMNSQIEKMANHTANQEMVYLE